jgi:serine/threonine protein kinase/tetratricopeptide (TPR) repeat protein
MKREHSPRVLELVRQVAELPTEEREQFLLHACAGDSALLQEVRSVLRNDASLGDTSTLPMPERGPADASSDPFHESQIPKQIGPYRLLETLGQGGMGSVFLAEQEQPLRRRVALKIIKLGMDTNEVVARFESERQALAMMNHTNIAKVLDAGSTEQGRPYFVMEYVPGLPLTEYCDRHQLSTRERLALFVPICHAIQHAHQKGIIHRDIKPSNILVAIENGKPIPKIIDFGVAKAVSQRLTEKTVYTQHGRLIGTPEYMSPEQAEMTGLDVDTTTDIYSLGVVLYEVLVGALPFDPSALRKAGLEAMHRIIREVDPPTPSSRISTLGDGAMAIAHHRRAEPPTLLRQIRGELDWITMRAIEKDRTRRYQAASELAADIQRYLDGEAVIAGRPSATYRLKKALRRHKAVVAAVSAVFLALALGLVVSTTLYVRAERARSRAEMQTRKAEQINQFLQNMLASAKPSEKGREVTVREVLDEAGKQAEKSLIDEPEVQASVRSTIGTTYMALGLFADAEAQLRRALLMRRSVLGENHPDVASSLDDLAALMLEKGDYSAAEPLYRSALAMNRRLLGERNAAVATNLGNIAALLKIQARYAEAESLCRESLTMTRDVLGENSADFATSLSNLATLLQAQGKYAEAEPLQRNALSTQRAILGASHPNVASSLHNLAGTLQAQGKYAEAEPLLREALAMEKTLYGDQHPSVPETLNNLAVVLDYQGNYAEAEPMYREALVLYKAVLGEKHQSIAACMNALAVLLQARGEYTEAESLHRQALAMRRELLGNTHPQVASSLSNLAALLQDRGQLTEAESLYRDALGIQEEALGADHPRVASTLFGLGSLLVDRGDAAAAEPLLRRCVRIRGQSYAPDSWQIARARNALGDCLRVEGRYAEAETLLVGSLPIIKGAGSLTLKQKQQAVQHVITLYEKWNKPTQAAVYRAELRRLAGL